EGFRRGGRNPRPDPEFDAIRQGRVGPGRLDWRRGGHDGSWDVLAVGSLTGSVLGEGLANKGAGSRPAGVSHHFPAGFLRRKTGKSGKAIARQRAGRYKKRTT